MVVYSGRLQMSFGPPSKLHGCFICLSPYWHRNLHDDKTKESLKIMNAFEFDMLPLLWRNVTFKNEHFCEHVCHSWLTRSLRSMVMQTNGAYKPEPMDYDLVGKEALRLEEMIDAVMLGVKNRNQISDSKYYIEVFARSSLGKKQRVTWKGSTGRKITGTWFGLAESLIEQYCANLELDDVHEREMRIIIWKHFILALVQHLIEVSSGPTRTFSRVTRRRMSLPALLEPSTDNNSVGLPNNNHAK